jgi:hypothetical protein
MKPLTFEKAILFVLESTKDNTLASVIIRDLAEYYMDGGLETDLGMNTKEIERLMKTIKESL